MAHSSKTPCYHPATSGVASHLPHAHPNRSHHLMVSTDVSATTGIRSNVIAALGNTPLVRLSNITKDIHTPVAAKLEMLNPGGSVKDRIGIRMIEEAERKGWLKPGGTIVEPTSGNTGVGLA